MSLTVHFSAPCLFRSAPCLFSFSLQSAVVSLHASLTVCVVLQQDPGAHEESGPPDQREGVQLAGHGPRKSKVSPLVARHS